MPSRRKKGKSRRVNQARIPLFWAMLFALVLVVIETAARGLFWWTDRESSRAVTPLTVGPGDIAIFGDSQTAGNGVAPHEAWPKQLEYLLGKSVANLSLDGNGPLEAFEMMKRVGSISVSRAVYALYSGNDLYDSYSAVYETDRWPDFRNSKVSSLLAELERRQPLREKVTQEFNSAIAWFFVDPPASSPFALIEAFHRFRKPAQSSWDSIRRRVAGRSDYFIVDSSIAQTILTPRYRLTAMDLGDMRLVEGVRISKEVLRKMAKFWSEKGVPFTVVFIPTKEKVFLDLAQRQTLSASYQSLIQNETVLWNQIRSYLESERIHYIETESALSADIASHNIYPITPDGHLRVRGHETVAKRVAESLR